MCTVDRWQRKAVVASVIRDKEVVSRHVYPCPVRLSGFFSTSHCPIVIKWAQAQEQFTAAASFSLSLFLSKAGLPKKLVPPPV